MQMCVSNKAIDADLRKASSLHLASTSSPKNCSPRLRMTKSGQEKSSDSRDAVRRLIGSIFGREFDPSSRYIVSLQGVSTSGKSTMAKTIYDYLVENGIRTYLLSLDNFYIILDGTLEDCFDYDFDNPAAMNWDNIFEVVNAIKNNEPRIPVFRRTSESSGAVGSIPNFNPTVLIIEGIYGFNVVEKNIFNVEQFDPYDSRKKIEKEFIPNPLDFSDFRIIKLHLTLCKGKALSIRTGRDILVRNIPVDFIVKRFEAHVWPDTERWIWSDQQCEDVQIIHGIFNHSKSMMVMQELLRFFTGRDIFVSLKPLRGDMRKESLVECSGNCILKKKTKLVLLDFQNPA